MPAERQRVFFTGSGPITAFGIGIDPLWSALVEGRSAIKPIASWDASGFECSAAAEIAPALFEVKGFVPKSHRKATKVMSRDIELAVGAAAEAVRSAGLVTRATEGAVPTLAPDRMGCQIGAGLIAADIDELTAALYTSRDADGKFDYGHWGEAGMQNLTPLWLLKYLPNMLACHVTIIHDCQGPSNTITCGESSATLSIGESMRVLQRGDADACLSGGAEARLHPMGMLRQIFAKRLAPTTGSADPMTLVKPFDASASGSILGEGGGIVVLETESSARGRNAELIAEVAGFGASHSFCLDTVGMESANGEEIAYAIEQVLDSARVKPAEIDAIVPFGSSIASTDRVEMDALRRVFKDRARSIPIVQVTPFIGNCGAGTGGVALAIAAQALKMQVLPARINMRGCTELDANIASSRAARLNAVLVVTTSLGGQNAAVVLKKTA